MRWTADIALILSFPPLLWAARPGAGSCTDSHVRSGMSHSPCCHGLWPLKVKEYAFGGQSSTMRTSTIQGCDMTSKKRQARVAGLLYLMVAFVVIAVAATFANSSNELAVLLIMSKPDFLSAFDPSHLEGIAYLFVRLQSHGIQIIQIFWGLWLIPMGILVYRSGFIPKIIGVSGWLAAFAYLMSNFTFVFLPRYKAALSPIITGLEMLELPIIFWLVIVGARTPPGETSWRKRALERS